MLLNPPILLLVLTGLQAKHFLFDFALQSDWQLRNKGRYGHPGGLVHAGLHAGGTLAVLGGAAVPGHLTIPTVLVLALADGAIHYHIDWLKAQLSKRLGLRADRQGYWVALGLDQAAHQATYLGLMAALIVL